jgi:hypothetical protein
METDNNIINTSADAALKSIKEAQLAGADISELIRSFNMALDLIDQAEKSQFDSCVSYDDCNEKAMRMFGMITNNAHLMKEQAAGASSFQRMVNLSIYAPLSAFVTSFAGYGLFRVWKAHQPSKLLEIDSTINEK